MSLLVLGLKGFVGIVVLEVEPVACGLLEVVLDNFGCTTVRTGLWASFGSFLYL